MTAFAKAAIAGVLAVGPLSAVQAAITREALTVSSAPGITVAIREVRDDAATHHRLPVILVHGARVPGVASFDLPVEGGSLAADLARAGHRVFIMDARGYGGSTRTGQDGPQAGAPLVRSDEVVADIDAVVRLVQQRTGAAKVALLGWATGGHWAGMFASRVPEAVSHLVLYNTLYGGHAGHPTLGPGSPLADPKDPNRVDAAKLGAYRLNTAASLLPAWDNSIPSTDKSLWRDPRVARAYQDAALASDPTSQSRTPPAFRAPSGAMADSFELASGRKLWHAGPITARVLILRSARDFWSRPEDVTALAADLTHAADVVTVTIPDATHHVHLDRAEKGRDAFLATVTRFLSDAAARASD